MKQIHNALLIGRGMIGCVFGTVIHNGLGPDDRFQVLVDAKRAERYRKNPLYFNHKRYDFSYVTPDNPSGETADLILIATKQTGLLDALDQIERYVGPDTLILPLQNGILSEEMVATRYGWDRTLYAFVYGNGLLTEEGYICPKPGKIVFGEKDNTVLTDRVKAIQDFLNRVGVHFESPADMRRAQWSKFVLNVGINQAAGVLRAHFGDFQCSPKSLAICRGLMEEAAQVAEAQGIDTTGMVEAALDNLLHSAPEGCPSLLMDIDAGRPTEIEIFAGTIRKLAAELDIPTPYNDLAYTVISAVDEFHIARSSDR